MKLSMNIILVDLEKKYSFKETNTFYRILSARVTLRPS